MFTDLQIDRRGFFLKNRPYAPVISPNPQTGQIQRMILDIGLESPLKWACGKKCLESGVFWQLSFGASFASLQEKKSAALPAFCRAITHFLSAYFPDYAAQTLGLCLYEGPLLLKEVPLIASWLQQLIPLFPEELPLFACFAVEKRLRLSQLAYMLSPHHFPYLHIGLAEHSSSLGVLQKRSGNWEGKARSKAELGVVLPKKLTASGDEEVDRVLASFEEKSRLVRLLYEAEMSEQWDELKEIVLFSEKICDRALRKVRGFLAAGGQVTTIGKPLGLIGEKSF